MRHSKEKLDDKHHLSTYLHCLYHHQAQYNSAAIGNISLNECLLNKMLNMSMFA